MHTCIGNHHIQLTRLFHNKVRCGFVERFIGRVEGDRVETIRVGGSESLQVLVGRVARAGKDNGVGSGNQIAHKAEANTAIGTRDCASAWSYSDL